MPPNPSKSIDNEKPIQRRKLLCDEMLEMYIKDLEKENEQLKAQLACSKCSPFSEGAVSNCNTLSGIAKRRENTFSSIAKRKLNFQSKIVKK